MDPIDPGAQTELTGIAAVALAAVVCGIVMERLRQPAIVGYILAGALLGPSGLGLVSDRGQVDVLAELGVLMLLYVVGMELSLRSFRRLWRLALLVTAIQIGASTGVMLLFSRAFGWPFGLSLLLGFVVALSSTAVAIKVLEGLGELRTRTGRITVGVLIAQDLAVVPMMLTIEALGGTSVPWFAALKIAGSVVFLAALIWFLSRGRKVRLPLLAMVAGHAELKPLAALAFCFCAAAVSGLVGLSAAYGAFLAGLVLGNSAERHAMMEATKPIESILMMVFFLSIGLLIDLHYIWVNLGPVLMLFLVVAGFKTVLNVGALRLLGQSWQQAFLSGVLLAQIGEFSFLLSLIGVANGVISPDDSRLVIAVTVLSLALSPLWVITARRLQGLAEAGRASAADVLGLVYRREAEWIARTWEDLRAGTLSAARRLAGPGQDRRTREPADPEAETPAADLDETVGGGPPAAEEAGHAAPQKTRKRATGRRRPAKGDAGKRGTPRSRKA